MDSDWLWKWVERGWGLIGTACAIATTYFTIGLFYHWDTNPNLPAKATLGAAMTPTLPWAIIALATLAITSLLTSWGMIFIRLRAKNSKEITAFSPRAAMLPFNEVEIGSSRLSQAAPWLELYFTFFNATGYATRTIAASGRISISGQEFHGHLETMDNLKWYGADGFFRIGLKVPISTSEGNYLRDALAQGHILVGFPNAKITFQIATPQTAMLLDIPLPSRLNFNSLNGRTDPYLPSQLSR